MPVIDTLTNEAGDLPQLLRIWAVSQEQQNAIANVARITSPAGKAYNVIAIANGVRVRSALLNYSNPASTYPDLADNPVSDPCSANSSNSFTYINPQPPSIPSFISLPKPHVFFPVCPSV